MVVIIRMIIYPDIIYLPYRAMKHKSINENIGVYPVIIAGLSET